MDLAFHEIPIAPKRRVHFHAFMLEVHQRLRIERTKGQGDPIPGVAEAIADRAGLTPDTLSVRVGAAMINVALRVAAERFADHADHEAGDEDDKDMADLIRAALEVVEDGLGPFTR